MVKNGGEEGRIIEMKEEREEGDADLSKEREREREREPFSGWADRDRPQMERANNPFLLECHRPTL